MCAGLLVDVFDKGFFVAAAAVVDRSGAAGGEELDGWVTLDAVFGGDGGVGFGVDLSDGDGGFGGEVGRYLFPGWFERFAVYTKPCALVECSADRVFDIERQKDGGRHTTTPRRCESDKYTLLSSNVLLEIALTQL